VPVFYSGIQKYAPHPPRELTASLGREVEKFDQLCDAIDAQLLRAIGVLQRDLGRERKRLQEAEKAAISSRTRSKSLSQSPTSVRAPLPGPGSDVASIDPTDQRPTQISPPPTSGGSGGSSGVPGRRGSTISLSSLHRPAFPHKLDLSSATLRLTAEEASMFSSGPLASPVTLAPKSARPLTSTDMPPDFMTAFEAATDVNSRPADIDLTLPDTHLHDGNASSNVTMRMDATLGNSADKPIELDLDNIDIDMTNMSDLFGDDSSTDANASLFSPATVGHELPIAGQNSKSVKQENLGMDILTALSVVGDTEGHEDLFASFSHHDGQPSDHNQSQPDTTANGLSASLDESGTAGAPLPGSLLTSFAAPQINTNTQSLSDAHNIADGNTPFDLIGLSNVFGGEPGSEANMAEIAELLKSGGFGPPA